jgi:phage gp45-like
MAQDISSLNMENRIRQLEEKVKKLEAYQEYRKHFLSLNEGEVIIRSYGGAAQIVMKKNGDIAIRGNKVTIVGSNDVFVKASTELILKGSGIGSN